MSGKCLAAVFLAALQILAAHPTRAAEADEELLGIRQGGKAGYINRKGDIVIAPQFSQVEPFIDGLAVVFVDQAFKKCGLIDRKGNFVAKPEYGHIWPFSEGVAAVSYSWVGGSGPAGFIDRSGNFAIKPVFERTSPFYGGIALVLDKTYGSHYIDKAGKPVWPSRPTRDKYGQWVYGGASGGPTPGLEPTPLLVDKSGKRVDQCGYVNADGVLSIPRRFDFCYPFGDGLAPVKLRDLFGFIDEKGRMVVAPRFEDAYYDSGVPDFSEGLAPVKAGGKWGYIDKSGAFALQPKFALAYPFGQIFGAKGLAEVCLKPGGDPEPACGYIDHAGKYIWEPTR